jgi:hypothetical protein
MLGRGLILLKPANIGAWAGVLGCEVKMLVGLSKVGWVLVWVGIASIELVDCPEFKR